MKTKLMLNEAVQVGPWRIARKHLLFVIVFCLVIISFGLIILQTQAFDKDGKEEEEEEGEGEGEEEGDEESGKWNKRFSSGDWVMVAIMVAAGLLTVVAVFVCIFVKKHAPRRLSATPRRTSVYSVQFNSEAAKNPGFGAPQQLPIWSGQIISSHQPTEHISQNTSTQQTILTLPQIIRSQPIQEEQVISDEHLPHNSPSHIPIANGVSHIPHDSPPIPTSNGIAHTHPNSSPSLSTSREVVEHSLPKLEESEDPDRIPEPQYEENDIQPPPPYSP